LVVLLNYEIKESENYIVHDDFEKERFFLIKVDTLLNKERKNAIHRITYSLNQIKFNSFVS